MQQAERLAFHAEDMLEKCYDPHLKAYTQAMNTKHLDASTLMMITMNYLHHNSQKAKDHIAALEKDLLADRSLFYRYKHYDDFGLPETTFLVCAFWYVDALACVGRTTDAIDNLNNLLQYGNHLGIFSEDVDIDGSQWGNFPQTYSHVGLINAAFRIWKKMEADDFI
jgi:GH15 family glucan-1,4-alpha-glucosidase